MCGRVSRPVRIFSAMIAWAGRLWRAIPTYSIEIPRSRLVVAAGRTRESVAFFVLFQIVFFYLVAERVARDVQQTGGRRFVPSRLFERLTNQFLLDIIE